MATKKLFNQVYIESKEQVYSKAVNALTLMAKGVSGVEFTPVLAPNGKVDATTTKYNVQRRKRPTVNAVANPNTGSTAAALAVLDTFAKTDWETLEVATGKLMSVGFNETIADDFDFSNSPQHSRDMLYQVGEIAAERHKDILALLDTATATGSALPAYVAKETKVWDAIGDEVIRLAAIDDKFKDVQGLSDFYIVTSNTVAKELAKEMGTAFTQEAAIAQTGFTSGKSINGTPVIVDARLQGREVYVAHNEAIAFGKQEIKNIAVDLGITQYTGAAFFDIMAIIDTARVSKISA